MACNCGKRRAARLAADGQDSDLPYRYHWPEGVTSAPYPSRATAIAAARAAGAPKPAEVVHRDLGTSVLR